MNCVLVAVFGFLYAINHTFIKEGTLEELELSHFAFQESALFFTFLRVFFECWGHFF